MDNASYTYKDIRYRDKLRNKLMHADSHEYNMTRVNSMAYNDELKIYSSSQTNTL